MVSERRLKLGEVGHDSFVSIGPDVPSSEALKVMKHHGIRHLIVIEQERLVGIISRRDIQVGSALHTLELIPVRRLMRAEVRVFSQDAPVAEVATAMAEAKLGAAVIVDGNGRPTGIFTTVDALKELAKRV